MSACASPGQDGRTTLAEVGCTHTIAAIAGHRTLAEVERYAKAADQKDSQMVCKSEAVLGSRLPVRRCRTVGDIKDRMLQDQQQVQRAQANLQERSN